MRKLSHDEVDYFDSLGVEREMKKGKERRNTRISLSRRKEVGRKEINDRHP